LRGKLFRAYLAAFKAAEDELKDIQETHITKTATAAVVKDDVSAPLSKSAIDINTYVDAVSTFDEVAVFGDDEPDDPQPNHDPFA